MESKVQETIDFQLIAEVTVVNDTVKLTANIAAMATGFTEEQLRENIREVMKKLIPDATWTFSGMSRSSDPSGMERVDIQASTRVSEMENYSLEKRARDVSREGLTVVSIIPDTTPPMSMIEKAESDLRCSLLTKARAEIEAVNAVMDSNYRVGAVAFHATQSDQDRRGGNTIMAMAAPMGGGMRKGPDLAGGSSFDDDTLGNAVKLTMRANVSLRRYV